VQWRELAPIEERTQWLAAKNQMKIKFTRKAQQKLGLRARMTRTEADKRILFGPSGTIRTKDRPGEALG
jgi:hypothetical protein